MTSIGVAKLAFEFVANEGYAIMHGFILNRRRLA